jgi:hypothetical protein
MWLQTTDQSTQYFLIKNDTESKKSTAATFAFESSFYPAW